MTSNQQVGSLRIGDVERDAVAAGLQDHFAQGRLTLDELHERLDAVFSARTADDLALTTQDLPPGGTPARGLPPVDVPRWEALGPGGVPLRGMGHAGPPWERRRWHGGRRVLLFLFALVFVLHAAGGEPSFAVRRIALILAVGGTIFTLARARRFRRGRGRCRERWTPGASAR